MVFEDTEPSDKDSPKDETKAPIVVLYDAWERRFKSDDDYIHAED